MNLDIETDDMRAAKDRVDAMILESPELEPFRRDLILGEYEGLLAARRGRGSAAVPADSGPPPKGGYGFRHGDQSAQFGSRAEAREYERRFLLTPEQRENWQNLGMTPGEIARAQMSERDLDAMNAGRQTGSSMVPIYNSDGTVGYAFRAPSDTPIPQFDPDPSIGATNFATGNRAVGPEVQRGRVRADLARPDLERLGYENRTIEGPYGTERAYLPTYFGSDRERKMRADLRAAGMSEEDINKQLAVYQNADIDPTDSRGRSKGLVRYTEDYEAKRRRAYAIKNAGMTEAEAAGMTVERIRQLGKEARDAERSERQERLRLARMNPAVRREAALDQMPDEWRNAVMAEMMAPGLDGMTPLGRDARGLENAMRFINAEAIGGNPELIRVKVDEARRQSNPFAAGIADLQAANTSSAEARAVLTQLLNRFDWGDWDGISDEVLPQLEAALAQPPYNITDPATRALVARDAFNSRAWMDAPAAPLPAPGGAPPGGGAPAPPPRRSLPWWWPA